MEFQNKNKKKISYSIVSIFSCPLLSNLIHAIETNRLYVYTQQNRQTKQKFGCCKIYNNLYISLNDVNLTKPNLFYQQNRFNDYFHHPQQQQ